MTRYLVSWEIDIDADTPEDAAKQALEIHRDPESTAEVFKVQTAVDEWVIDLSAMRCSNES